MKILIVSSANMDFVMQMERVPEAGQTVIDPGSYRHVPGGKGANSAVAFSRLGGKSVFSACLGKDANGDFFMELFEREGIDTRFISRDEEALTGLAAIFVEKTGQNRIVVYPGANLCVREEDVVSAIADRPDALFMQLEIKKEAILFAASEAARAGIPIFLDAGPADPSFPLSALPRLTVFSPNETETEIFTGIRPLDGESALAAARVLETKVKAEHYVLKLGSVGCYIYTPERSERGTLVPAYHLLPVVDTTAAGDAFTAALTLKYLETGDILASARYANAVGAITVSRMGASPSIPSEEEILSFLSENRISI